MPNGKSLMTPTKKIRKFNNSHSNTEQGMGQGGRAPFWVTYVLHSQYMQRRTHSWRNDHNYEQPFPSELDGPFCCNTKKEKAAKVMNMQLQQLSSPLRLPSPNLSQSRNNHTCLWNQAEPCRSPLQIQKPLSCALPFVCRKAEISQASVRHKKTSSSSS